MINGLGLFFLFIPGLRCRFGRLELGLDSRIRRRYGPIGVDRLGGVELGLSSRYLFYPYSFKRYIFHISYTK